MNKGTNQVTQYRIIRFENRYVLQCRNSVIGVGIWWSDVCITRSRNTAKHWAEKHGTTLPKN